MTQPHPKQRKRIKERKHIRSGQRCIVIECAEFVLHSYQTILLKSFNTQPKVIRPSQGDAASFHQLLANV